MPSPRLAVEAPDEDAAPYALDDQRQRAPSLGPVDGHVAVVHEPTHQPSVEAFVVRLEQQNTDGSMIVPKLTVTSRPPLVVETQAVVQGQVHFLHPVLSQGACQLAQAPLIHCHDLLTQYGPVQSETTLLGSK